MTKAEQVSKRIDIVNAIITEISMRGRRFFYSKKTSNVAQLSERNGRVYYLSEHSGKLINLSIPDTRRPKDWQHGGTLLALIRDMKDYIKTGKDSNHNHGYGGLFSPHWGYSEEDMVAIREKAHELGYLQSATLYKKKEDEVDI